VQEQYLAVYNYIYDNPSRSLKGLACANLITIYPKLVNVPGFPFIGGAPNTSHGSPNCGACWKVTNVENNMSIHFTSIDDTDSDDRIPLRRKRSISHWKLSIS
jgi:Cerato-platanin